MKASYSELKLCTKLCAIVPLAIVPNFWAVDVQDVPIQPPITAALAPKIAASIECARLAPNSITGRPFAADTIIVDFVAIKLWWLRRSKTIVSIICASIIGALTVSKGSLGKITVPSGIAQMSPVNLKVFR